MKFTKLLSFLSLCFSFGLHAQIVQYTPTFPTQDDELTIVFDITKTTTRQGSLIDTTEPIYAHMGLVTSAGSNTAWISRIALWPDRAALEGQNCNIDAVKLSKIGDNLYQLVFSPTLKEFFIQNTQENPPHVFAENEVVQRLEIVLRNHDGSLDGRGAGDNRDNIVLNIYQDNGLKAKFVDLPVNKVVEKGSQLDIKVVASKNAELTIFHNNIPLQTLPDISSMTQNVTFSEEGTHTIKYTVVAGLEMVSESVVFTVPSSSLESPRPAGLERGANYIEDNTVILLLYAPRKRSVSVVSDLSNWTKQPEYQMYKDGDYFWITLTGLTAGREYCYYYSIDDQVNVADPYARKVLERNFDVHISPVAYPNLTPFPAACTERIVSIFQTAQPEVDYVWEVTDFQAPRKDQLVIYEMLIRDFTNDGTPSATYSGYLEGAIEKLDYIKSLGVNAVELMPVIFQDGTPNDAGSMNWGYHTTFFFAPMKAYGTPADYKRFVDECHKRGLAVILDLQLDHAWGTCPLVRMYADPVGNTQAKPAADNPWFNQESPNTHYRYGADFNHESPGTRAMMRQVVAYWLREYKFDGYRFDFSKGLTQTPGEGTPYDAARIAILKDYADTAWEVNPNAYIILEHFCERSEEKELAAYGMMPWGKQYTVFSNAIAGDNRDSNFAAGTPASYGWNADEYRINYMESHDEERLAVRAMEAGVTKDDFAYSMKRCGLAAAFFLSMQGPRMMWQFGEMGYDYSIRYSSVPPNVVSTNRVAHSKPPRWDYLEVPERIELHNVYRTILNLRGLYPQVFSDGTYRNEVNNADWPMRTISITHSDLNFVLVGNFGETPQLKAVGLTGGGTWYDLFSGNEVSGSTIMLTIQPGEFRLFTNKKVDIPSSVEEIAMVNKDLIIYPNPAVETIYFRNNSIVQAELYAIDGKLIIKQAVSNNRLDISMLEKGSYIIKLIDRSGAVHATRFIKNAK